MKKPKPPAVRGVCSECGRVRVLVQDRCAECYHASASVLVALEDA